MPASLSVANRKALVFFLGETENFLCACPKLGGRNRRYVVGGGRRSDAEHRVNCPGWHYLRVERFRSILLFLLAAINGDVREAVAEVTNMTTGNVKNILEQDAGPLASSVPDDNSGSQFRIRQWVRSEKTRPSHFKRARNGLRSMSHSRHPGKEFRYVPEFPFWDWLTFRKFRLRGLSGNCTAISVTVWGHGRGSYGERHAPERQVLAGRNCGYESRRAYSGGSVTRPVAARLRNRGRRPDPGWQRRTAPGRAKLSAFEGRSS